MAKKKLDENNSVQPEVAAEETRPVKKTAASSEETQHVPVKTRGSTKKAVELAQSIPQVEAPPEEPEKPQKQKRAGWIWLGILCMLVIVGIGVLIGYNSAIQVRKAEEQTQILVAATTQYELSLQDISAGNLSMAKRRLEYVIQIYPTYPGAADKMAEVLVGLAKDNQNTTIATVAPVIEATPDTRGAATIFAAAQQQLASSDWNGLYESVNSLRNLDPTYQAVKVDGMYYLALRNVGLANIKSGNMEEGIYQFAVAEQIAPIDSEADNWRQLAELYINGISFWGVDWNIVTQDFYQLNQSYPYFADFNGITTKDRYAAALEGYGDTLELAYDWCGARDQYSTSSSIKASQSLTDKLTQANEYCANPPATPTPTFDPYITPTPTNSP